MCPDSSSACCPLAGSSFLHWLAFAPWPYLCGSISGNYSVLPAGIPSLTTQGPEYWSKFWSQAILTNVQKHLLKSFLIVFQYTVSKIFYYVCPRYFTLGPIVKDIVSKISVSSFSLLVCRNMINTFILIFYPASLIISLISFKNIFVDSLGFSKYTVINISFVNKDSFISSFLIHMLFISLSCLMALAQASSKMLNRTSGSRHPCFLPVFGKSI